MFKYFIKADFVIQIWIKCVNENRINEVFEDLNKDLKCDHIGPSKRY